MSKQIDLFEELTPDPEYKIGDMVRIKDPPDSLERKDIESFSYLETFARKQGEIIDISITKRKQRKVYQILFKNRKDGYFYGHEIIRGKNK